MLKYIKYSGYRMGAKAVERRCDSDTQYPSRLPDQKRDIGFISTAPFLFRSHNSPMHPADIDPDENAGYSGFTVLEISA